MNPAARTLEVVASESAANGNAAMPVGDEYAVDIKLVGTTPLLMHRYDVASVAAKSRAAKNSATKKSDDVESYLYRDEGGKVGIPGKALWASLRDAGASIADPRSPRKSAKDLIKAVIRVEPFIASIGKTTWDYIDESRVLVQRVAISRQRPAFKSGWTASFTINVLAGEYITPDWLHDLVSRSGRFVGLCDGRPLYGLFRVDHFAVRKLLS